MAGFAPLDPPLVTRDYSMDRDYVLFVQCAPKMPFWAKWLIVAEFRVG